MSATVAKYVERLKPDQTMDPFDSLVFCAFFFSAPAMGHTSLIRILQPFCNYIYHPLPPSLRDF